MNLELYVGAEHPALAGHFPGNPIVPAAVIVQRVAGDLAEATGIAINEVRQLRLQHPLRPGEHAHIRCEARGDRAWRVTVMVKDQVIAKGTFGHRSGVTGPAGLESAGRRVRFDAASAYQWLPHAGDMALVNDFERDESGTSFSSIVHGPGHPLEDSAGLLPWVSLEYAAQLYGCSTLLAEGGSARGGRPMSHAYIVMVRSLQVDSGLALAVGGRAEIALRVVSEQGSAAQCAFEACASGHIWCRGEFTVVSGDSGS